MNNNEALKDYFNQFDTKLDEAHLNEASMLLHNAQDELFKNLQESNIKISKVVKFFHQIIKKKQSIEEKQEQVKEIKPRLSNSVGLRQVHKDIIKQNKEIQERKLLQIKQQEEKIIQSQEEEKKKQQDFVEEQKRLRAQKAEKKLQELKDMQQKRSEDLKIAKEKVKEISTQKPLYQLKEEESKKEALETLRERKQKLESLRDLYKPVTKQEIIEHNEKINQLKKQIEEVKQAEREKQFDEQKNIKSYDHGEYYKKLELEKLKKIKEEEEKKKKLDDMIARKKYFATLVREHYKPQVSEEKQLEIKQMIDKSHHQKDFKKYKQLSKKIKRKKKILSSSMDGGIQEEDEEYIEESDEEFQIEAQTEVDKKELGRQYLEFAKSKAVKQDEIANQSYDFSQKAQSEIDGPKNQGLGDKRMQQSQNEKRDYLKELKKQHKIPDRDLLTDWQKVAQSHQLDEQQKNEHILYQAKKLEQEAQKKETLNRIKNNRYEKNEGNVDDYYIEAIKAKLTVLDK